METINTCDERICLSLNPKHKQRNQNKNTNVKAKI